MSNKSTGNIINYKVLIVKVVSKPWNSDKYFS